MSAAQDFSKESKIYHIQKSQTNDEVRQTNKRLSVLHGRI